MSCLLTIPPTSPRNHLEMCKLSFLPSFQFLQTVSFRSLPVGCSLASLSFRTLLILHPAILVFEISLIVLFDLYRSQAYSEDIMDINFTQTCSADNGTFCTEYVYSGRTDDIQISIPMLEAMGLLFLWLLIVFFIAWLFRKFS